MEASQKFVQYISSNVMYKINRSNYGARRSTTQTTNLPNARLVIGGIDQEFQNKLQSQLAELRSKISANEGRIKASKREEEKLREKDSRLRKMVEEPKARRNDLRRAAETFKRLELEIGNTRRAC